MDYRQNKIVVVSGMVNLISVKFVSALNKPPLYGTPHKKVYVSYLTLSVVRYEVRTILAYFLLTLVRS